MDRLERLRTLLMVNPCDVILLVKAENIAAFFRGARMSLGFRQEPSGRVAICVTAADAVLLGNQTEVTRMQRDELSWLPDLRTEAIQWDSWGLDVSVWEYLRSQRFDQVCDDTGTFGEDITAALEDMYYPLADWEERRIRALAQDAARIVEAVAKSIRPGATETQIAGELCGRLVAASIWPEFVMVASDERISALRHCMPRNSAVRLLALLSATVHRQGLYVSLTRMVSFRPVPKEWIRLQAACNHVDAAVISESKPGRSVGDLFRTMVASYAAQGYPDEWRCHHQGGPAGFCGRDYKATAVEKRYLVERQPVVWNPTVRGAKSEDTILTRDAGEIPDILTHTGDWLYNEIATESGPVLRPAILPL